MRLLLLRVTKRMQNRGMSTAWATWANNVNVSRNNKTECLPLKSSATFDGENCAQEVWPEGTREAVRRAFQGKAWAGGGNRGRFRTALGRRYARARARTVRS